MEDFLIERYTRADGVTDVVRVRPAFIVKGRTPQEASRILQDGQEAARKRYEPAWRLGRFDTVWNGGMPIASHAVLMDWQGVSV